MPKHTGEKEPDCTAGRRITHDWAARTFGGVGYIEEKVCVNCGLIATRTPPVVENGEVTEWSGFTYKKP